MFESRISAGATEKLPWSENMCISSWSCDMEGHAKKCVGKILWVGKQDDSTILQSINTMHWQPSFQRRRIEIRVRIAKSMLSNCSEMLIFGTCLEDLMFYGQWISLHDRSQNEPKLVTNDYLVWSLTFITHVNTDSIVMWVILQYNADWDCFKTPILQEILRIQNLHQVEHCAFWKSYICSNQFGRVQKQTSVSHSSTESENISLDAGLRFGWYTRNWFLGSDRRSLGNTNQSHKEWRDPLMNKREVRSTPPSIQKRKMECSMIWTKLILSLQTSNLLIRKLCCMCLKTTKNWSRWLQMQEARQWDMFPEPTELLFIGCSIESTWTPKSKSNTLTPRTNSQTYWPREISLMMNGIIFCVCSTSAISVPSIVLKWGRKERKKMLVKKESQQNRSDDEIGLSRCSERNPNVLASSASESPGKTRYESQIPLSSCTEQQPRTGRFVLDACSSSYSKQNADEKWMVFSTENLVKCRTQVRRDP